MPRMTARSRTENRRTSTPLELFFDLCFVVAVAQAGGRLVHAVAEGHPGTGMAGYLGPLHTRHFKRDLAEQLPLPLAAVAILACTFAGEYAVFAAGLVAAATVTAGVALSRRPAPGGPASTSVPPTHA